MKRITSTLLALILCGCTSIPKDPLQTRDISYIPKGATVDAPIRSKIIDSNYDGTLDTYETKIKFRSENLSGETTIVKKYDNGNLNPNPLKIETLTREEFLKNGETWIRSIRTEQHDSGTEKVTSMFNLPPAWNDYHPDGKIDYKNSSMLEQKKISFPIPKRFQRFPTESKPKAKVT
jgi:hypothetical protein